MVAERKRIRGSVLYRSLPVASIAIPEQHQEDESHEIGFVVVTENTEGQVPQFTLQTGYATYQRAASDDAVPCLIVRHPLRDATYALIREVLDSRPTASLEDQLPLLARLHAEHLFTIGAIAAITGGSAETLKLRLREYHHQNLVVATPDEQRSSNGDDHAEESLNGTDTIMQFSEAPVSFTGAQGYAFALSATDLFRIAAHFADEAGAAARIMRFLFEPTGGKRTVPEDHVTALVGTLAPGTRHRLAEHLKSLMAVIPAMAQALDPSVILVTVPAPAVATLAAPEALEPVRSEPQPSPPPPPPIPPPTPALGNHSRGSHRQHRRSVPSPRAPENGHCVVTLTEGAGKGIDPFIPIFKAIFVTGNTLRQRPNLSRAELSSMLLYKENRVLDQDVRTALLVLRDRWNIPAESVAHDSPYAEFLKFKDHLRETFGGNSFRGWIDAVASRSQGFDPIPLRRLFSDQP
jgi:hypothetical protein